MPNKRGGSPRREAEAVESPPHSRTGMRGCLLLWFPTPSTATGTQLVINKCLYDEGAAGEKSCPSYNKRHGWEWGTSAFLGRKPQSCWLGGLTAVMTGTFLEHI